MSGLTYLLLMGEAVVVCIFVGNAPASSWRNYSIVELRTNTAYEALIKIPGRPELLHREGILDVETAAGNAGL